MLWAALRDELARHEHCPSLCDRDLFSRSAMAYRAVTVNALPESSFMFMWFIVLIILAIVAFFIIKAFTGRSGSQSSGGSAPNSELSNGSANTQIGNASDARQSHTGSGSATGAAAGTAVAAAGAAAAAAGSASSGASSSGADASGSGSDSSASTSGSSGGTGLAGAATGAVVSMQALQSGDAISDVREMIKVLNLRGSDASRLSIAKEQFEGIWAGDKNALSSDELSQVADKLRRMLA